MSKFKVGDKVHYVGSIYRYVVGHGIIMRVLEAVEYPYSVSFNGQSSCPCSEDELELVEESDGYHTSSQYGYNSSQYGYNSSQYGYITTVPHGMEYDSGERAFGPVYHCINGVPLTISIRDL